jgi:hypothetical protein
MEKLETWLSTICAEVSTAELSKEDSACIFMDLDNHKAKSHP